MSHDYDPSWDYEVVEDLNELGLHESHIKVIKDAIDDIKKPSGLCAAMGFDEIEVFFVKPDGIRKGSCVAIYINGTSSRPVIGLDPVATMKAARDYGVDFAIQVRASLAHELAHAYQESMGLDHDHDDGFDEDDAESFAKLWAEQGVIDLELLAASEDQQAEAP